VLRFYDVTVWRLVLDLGCGLDGIMGMCIRYGRDSECDDNENVKIPFYNCYYSMYVSSMGLTCSCSHSKSAARNRRVIYKLNSTSFVVSIFRNCARRSMLPPNRTRKVANTPRFCRACL
jgi:hypothetical protein